MRSRTELMFQVAIETDIFRPSAGGHGRIPPICAIVPNLLGLGPMSALTFPKATEEARRAVGPTGTKKRGARRAPRVSPEASPRAGSGPTGTKEEARRAVGTTG